MTTCRPDDEKKRSGSTYFEVFEKLEGGGSSSEQVGMQIAGLVKGVREDLPGLPLVEGVVSEKSAKKNVCPA